MLESADRYIYIYVCETVQGVRADDEEQVRNKEICDLPGSLGAQLSE